MIDITKRSKINIVDKPISVIGLGKSGVSAAKLAQYLGAQVRISDLSTSIDINVNADKLLSEGINVETGQHSAALYESDLWIVSPGIDKNSDIIKKAKNLKIPIVGEIEFASWFTNSLVIAITGSNGKTTTVNALNKMCQTKDLKGLLGGNIGTPFSLNVLDEITKNNDNYIHILEISSFQMETIMHFKPNICVFLNISPDHLNRHGTIEEYIKMKLNMAKNLDGNDFIVYNIDDKRLRNSFKKHPAKHSPFSICNQNTEFYVYKTKIIDSKGNFLINKEDISISGKHNLSNLLAAATAAKLAKIPNDRIAHVFKTFTGVAHRLENVAIVNNITYINDSKATNLDSVIVAINSINKPLILLMGGKNKGTDFRLIVPYVKSCHVKLIITYGEAAGEILTALGDAVRSIRKIDLNSAVKSARSMAMPGDVVLLSPGCASFDQFKDFEERGNLFKKLVINNYA